MNLIRLRPPKKQRKAEEVEKWSIRIRDYEVVPVSFVSPWVEKVEVVERAAKSFLPCSIWMQGLLP
jgi:hypothetical protein